MAVIVVIVETLDSSTTPVVKRLGAYGLKSLSKLRKPPDAPHFQGGVNCGNARLYFEAALEISRGSQNNECQSLLVYFVALERNSTVLLLPKIGLSEGKPDANKCRHTHAPFPQQVVIEVTAGCNQQCINCGRTYMARPKKTMKRSVFEKIVREVADENRLTEIWPTFMGEAMLLGRV